MNGVLVVDKPAGPTSHDVVAAVRRAFREEKVGHTGTLDPMATGVLPLVLGRATRLARFFSAGDKAYDADIRLGLTTDTYDATGTRAPSGRTDTFVSMDAETIESALADFRGTYRQEPPPYSAKKIDGVRAYAMARRNRPVRPAAVSVTVSRLALVAVIGDLVSVHIECSAGFYVRSLAHELGQRLGTGACLDRLRRTRSGQFGLDGAVALDVCDQAPHLLAERVVPMERLLMGLPGVTVTEAGARRVAHGNPLRIRDVLSGSPGLMDPHGRVRLLDPDGLLLAIGEPGAEPGTLRPAVVLV